MVPGFNSLFLLQLELVYEVEWFDVFALTLLFLLSAIVLPLAELFSKFFLFLICQLLRLLIHLLVFKTWPCLSRAAMVLSTRLRVKPPLNTLWLLHAWGSHNALNSRFERHWLFALWRASDILCLKLEFHAWQRLWVCQLGALFVRATLRHLRQNRTFRLLFFVKAWWHWSSFFLRRFVHKFRLALRKILFPDDD